MYLSNSLPSLLAAARHLPLTILWISTVGAQTAAPLANPSFELPARTTDQPGARPSIESWQFAQAGVIAADGLSPAPKGGEGTQFGYLAAVAGGQVFQDLPGGLTPRSEYVFRLNLGVRGDAQPDSGSSVNLRIQTLDANNSPTANLAIRTIFVERDKLSADTLTPFEVAFTTDEIAPPGKVRLLVDVNTPSAKPDGVWLMDAAIWEVTPLAPPVKAAIATPVSTAPSKYSYSRDISPILSENCFPCHGPDREAREAKLRLDIRDSAVAPNKYGDAAIVPGDPEASIVLERMLSDDEDEIMPPPESHKLLTKEQIGMIRQWIQDGAVYESHWSFQPVVRHPLPEVSKKNWVRQPLDAFVLAKLEANGLDPAPEADRRTLARRVSLDLTGLAPTPEMLDAFLADTAPDAYEKYVDRLLAMPQWGEQRGRYWLDAARYADTHGIHFDNYREIWGYRDWVINAYNRNLPFDRFTTEQLAGDLMPDSNEESLIATGYNRCNISTNEGGIIQEEYKVLYSIDRTATMSTIWLGLTTACAACHDHKFDPIPTGDFYSLAAFFNNSTTPVMDGNAKDPEPTTLLLVGDDRTRWQSIESEIAAAETALKDFLAAAQGHLAARQGEIEATLQKGTLNSTGLVYQAGLAGPADAAIGGKVDQLEVIAGSQQLPAAAVPAPTIVEGPAGTRGLRLAEPGLALPEFPALDTHSPFSVGLWVNLDSVQQTGSLLARLDDTNGFVGFDLWMQGGMIGTHLVRSWADDAIKVVSEGRIADKAWHHVMLSYDGSSKAAGVKLYIDGVEQRVRVEADNLRSPIRTEVPFRLGRRESRDAIGGLSVAGLRYFDRAIGGDEVNVLATDALLPRILTRPAAERSDAERQFLFDAYLARFEHEAHQAALNRIAALKAEKEAIRVRTPKTLVFKEADTLPVSYVLNRGEYDQRLDLVPAKTPEALPPMAGDLPRNRLGLAKWLLADDNPLTTRVTVNRFWLELFGRGLVNTPSDFGLTGQTPSHPELLDWIAVEFREKSWDIKAFYRMLVTSATYRQDAGVDALRIEKDPANILLSRGPRFRMDGEMIRDHALAVSGLLSPKLCGPSVKPYQPDGVWEGVAMNESNTRNYQRDKGESLYRRSLYTFWKRSAPPASMEVFNAPNRQTCTIQRERGNTPIQALATLNDPQLVEAARNLAQRVLLGVPAGDEATRLNAMAVKIISRPLRDIELTVLKESLTEMRANYTAAPTEATALLTLGESVPDSTLPPSEVAAWTMIANQLLNLDETLTK